ncbi:MAG: Grx4 family monothiol glutaredoxin [Myxococcota bacterium]
MIRSTLKKGLKLGLDLGRIAVKEVSLKVKEQLGTEPERPEKNWTPPTPPAGPTQTAQKGAAEKGATQPSHGHSHSHSHNHSHSHSHSHSHGQASEAPASEPVKKGHVAEVQLGKKPGSAQREGLPRRTADVDSYLKDALEKNPVLLFVKGTPSAPACGFSAKVIDLFNRTGVQYQTVNVLEDYEVREGIKAFTQWPTIPQIFVRGQFIGGADIVTELFQNGELQASLQGLPTRT